MSEIEMKSIIVNLTEEEKDFIGIKCTEEILKYLKVDYEETPLDVNIAESIMAKLLRNG